MQGEQRGPKACPSQTQIENEVNVNDVLWTTSFHCVTPFCPRLSRGSIKSHDRGLGELMKGEVSLSALYHGSLKGCRDRG